MVFKDFLERVSQKRSFRKQIKLQEKEGEFEARASRLEKEAELSTSVGKKRARIRKARKKIFEGSATFKTIKGFRKVGQQLGKAGKAARKFKPKVSGLGVASENLFFREAPSQRRRSRKKRKRRAEREIEDDLFEDLGTDRFF